jgi:D-3-phosphoglycerate dehydrogenase
MKKGVRIITARGGLVDEAALYEALKGGKVAGAAFVFVEEPATNRCSPAQRGVRRISAPLPAAQENVALRSPNKCRIIFARGDLNAVNFPSITAEEARGHTLYRPGRKTRFVLGTTHRNRHQQGADHFEGAVAQMKTKALTSSAIAGYCGRSCRTSMWSRRLSSLKARRSCGGDDA